MATYTSPEGPCYSAAPLASPSQAVSLVSCVILCYSWRDSPCYSVTYNTINGSCTPGSKLTYLPSSPERVAEELFLYSDFCNTTLGFNLYALKSVVQCLHVSTDQVDFITAREICAGKGSTLYLVKSKDKFNLLQNIVLNSTLNHTWVGLSDLDTEGSYVWEDGQSATDSPFPVPWRRNQPDDGYDGEDCVISERRSGYLNDYKCSLLIGFICERNPL